MQALERVDAETDRLITEGDWALRAMKFRRRAAEYAAAASELEQAIEKARSGEPEMLASWLRGSRHPVQTEIELPPFPSMISISQPEEAQPENADPEGREVASKKSMEMVVTETTRFDRRELKAEGKKLLESAANAESIQAPKGLLSPDRCPKRDNKHRRPIPSEPIQSTSQTLAVDSGSRKDKVQKDLLVRNSIRSLPGWLISVGIHLILVLGLGIYTIRSLEPPTVLAIHAAPMESDSVSLQLTDSSSLSEEEIEISEPSESFDVKSLTSLDASVLESSNLTEIATAASISNHEATGTPEEVSQEISQGDIAKSEGLAMDSIAKGVQAEFFGVQATGNTFCYIVDSSGSMRRDGAFEAAKRELLRSIASMKETQRFFVYFFSEEIEGLRIGEEQALTPVAATPENIQAAARWMDSIQIRGGKSPNQVLDMAIEMDPDGIFLLFDGDTRVDVAKHLEKTNRIYDIIHGSIPKVPIHTVGFNTREYEPLLRRIAEQNRGTYRFVLSPRLGQPRREFDPRRR